MNESNVEAMFQVIREFEECDVPDCSECRERAEFYASRGVLVPRAVNLPAHYAGAAAELERIAKGEA
jgi:hypothetical protein